MAIQEIPVVITSQRAESSSGVVRLEIWDQKERLKRALKFLGISWGLALASAPLPPIHWVLVPVFLIAGPIGAWITYGKDRMITGGEGICPQCKSPLPIAKATEKWPLSDLCTGCQSSLSIQKSTHM